jgi:hypothetical protein
MTRPMTTEHNDGAPQGFPVVIGYDEPDASMMHFGNGLNFLGRPFPPNRLRPRLIEEKPAPIQVPTTNGVAMIPGERQMTTGERATRFAMGAVGVAFAVMVVTFLGWVTVVMIRDIVGL